MAAVLATSGSGPTPYRFTVAEFERLCEAGILTDDRVELIDGELLLMRKVGGRHTGCIIRLDRTIQRLTLVGCFVSAQNPLLIDDRAEFLPDLAVCQGTGESNSNPRANRARLVIEVADSSRTHDRTVKFPRYATAGIAEAWLVDLADDRLERHTEPREGGYRQIVWARRGEALDSTVLPGLVLDVDAVLGPPDEA